MSNTSGLRQIGSHLRPSLAEDFTWYTQFENTANSQPNPATHRVVTPGPSEKHGILSETLKWVLKIIGRHNVQVEELPSTRSQNAPPADCCELRSIEAANVVFNLKLLEWDRSKIVRHISSNSKKRL
jgi:hypothetical protein